MSLFGGQQPASSQPGFGSTPSLFGVSAQSSASLFGAPQSSASLFGAPAQSSASLFGAPQSSASLFGAPTQSSPSLFGAPQSSASLFGAPAQSSASLFGAPASSASLFGAASQPGLWGQNPAQQQQQQQPQQTAPPQDITGRTRISQLPQNFQTDLFAVERHLREQRTKGSKLWAKRRQFETEIGQTKAQAANITRRMVKLQANLESLKANSDTLKAAVRTERASAEPIILALENYKSGHSSQVGFLGGSNAFRYTGLESDISDRATRVPEEYFMRVIEELESRAHEYKSEIDEIAEYLRAQGVSLSRTLGSGAKMDKAALNMGVTDSITQRHVDMGITTSDEIVTSKGKTIEDVIRRQYEYFMVVASHVAGVHENLRFVREQFLQLLRRRDPDMLDPFQQADLREKAEKERQRIIADKRASEDTMGFGKNPLAPHPQGSFQSQSGMSASALGSTSFGLSGQGSGFGADTGAGFGNALDGGGYGANGSQSKKNSTGRRRRS